jgi:hypothetical protein
MSFHFRYFQIPYLVIATYFVGSTIGRIGTLNEEVLEIRRLHAWDRSQITKTLIEDMQADVHDDDETKSISSSSQFPSLWLSASCRQMIWNQLWTRVLWMGRRHRLHYN